MTTLAGPDAILRDVAERERLRALENTINMTPTPWEIDGDYGIIFGIAPHDNGEVRVAKLLHDATNDIDAERCIADAAVIRAAPEMQSVLRKLLAWSKSHGIVSEPVWTEAADTLRDSERWPRPAPLTGKLMRFDWLASNGKPAFFPGLSKHTGQIVSVLENRDDAKNMFVIAAADGWRGIAFRNELRGVSDAELAARIAGWTVGGDNGGIAFNANHYSDWKEATSWSGEDGAPSPTYGPNEWDAIVELESIRLPALIEGNGEYWAGEGDIVTRRQPTKIEAYGAFFRMKEEAEAPKR